MKISFGYLRNNNLKIGKNLQMRPTDAKAKSVMFNTLNIADFFNVIDIFSGTGSLGFESISLGAKKVYFCDNNKKSYLAIKENIKNFNLDKENFKVFNTDFRIFLNKIDFKADLIFLDPPFIAKHYYDEALKIILEKQLLKEDGIIILEKMRKTTIKYISYYFVTKTKKLGEKEILFLKYKEK